MACYSSFYRVQFLCSFIVTMLDISISFWPIFPFLQTTALKTGALHHDIHYWLGKDTSQVKSLYDPPSRLYPLLLYFLILWVFSPAGWSWYCSAQNYWVGCSAGWACCSIPRSARSRNREVPFSFQAMYNTRRRWSCLRFQARWSWGAPDSFVCM